MKSRYTTSNLTWGHPRCHYEHSKHSSGVANQAQHPWQPDNNLFIIIYRYIIQTGRELKLVGYFNQFVKTPKQTNKRQQQGSDALPGMKQQQQACV